MKDIRVYRVPQFMSKKVNVICVDGVPVCTVRGKRSTSDIVAKLSGYDVKVSDGRIDKLVERLKCESIVRNLKNPVNLGPGVISYTKR